MLIVDSALAIHDSGYPIVFVSPGEKGPQDKGWHLERFTRGEIERRFQNNPAMNVGLILGPASGVIDLEGDGPTAPADLVELFAGCEMPDTPSWQARRGKHYLFAWDDRLNATRKAVVKIGSLELRLGTGGKAAQSLLPPSTTDGFKREWTRELSADLKPAKLPDVVVDRILTAARKEPKPDAAPLDPKKPGDDFCRRATWQEILTPHGWTDLGGDHWRRPGKSEGISGTTDCTSGPGRELFFCFSTNAPPFEADHSYSKFSAFAHLNHGGDFHAAAAALTKLGYGEQPGRITFERITSAELASGNYRLEYLIDRTLVAGQPCIVAGPKKALKTSILIELAIALASGGDFLGRLPAKRAKVGVMSGESGLATIQETARRVAKARGVLLAKLDDLIWSTSLPKFGNAEHADALKRFIEFDKLEVLILDPIYLCLPGADAGNLFIQGELLSSLNEICQSFGVTSILCHHTRKHTGKGDPFAPMELENLAWAGFSEFARQWLLLGRREAYEPGTGEHRLWLNVGGSAGHSALWAVDISEGIYDGETPRGWDVRVTTAEDARQEAREHSLAERQSEAKERILTALKQFPAGETVTQLSESASITSTAARSAIDELVKEGRVLTCEIQKPNRKAPYDGFRLAA